MRGLDGKGVLVCGGSSGIGLAAAQRFLEEGSRVFIAGLEPSSRNRCAAASPIPLLPPHTRTPLPSRPRISHLRHRSRLTANVDAGSNGPPAGL